MNEMNILTLNGERYEVADQKARESKADKAYVDKTFAPVIPVTMTGTAVSTDMVSPVEHEVQCKVIGDNVKEAPVNISNSNIFAVGIRSDYYIEPNAESSLDSINFRVEGNSLRALATSSANSRVIRNQNFPVGSFAFTADYSQSEPRIQVYCFDERGYMLDSRTATVTGSSLVYNEYMNGWYTNQIPAEIHVSGCAYWRLGFCFYGDTGTDYSISNIQLNIGSNLYPYEVAELVTLIADNEGILHGLKSKGCYLSAFAKNANQTLTVTYNADTKKYIKDGGANTDDSIITASNTWSSKKVTETFASAIPITVAGTAIGTDIISPVECKVKCKVSNVSNPDTVTLSRYGKNMAFLSFRKSAEDISYKFNPDKSLSITMNSGTSRYAKLVFDVSYLPTNFNFCIYRLSPTSSTHIDLGLWDSSDTVEIGRAITIKPGEDFGCGSVKNNKFNKGTITVYPNIPVGETLQLGIMISVIDGGDKYTAPIEPVNYRPDSNGDLIIPSLYPDMTIVSDNPKAIIEATYNADTKKYIDHKFTELQSAILSTGGNV